MQNSPMGCGNNFAVMFGTSVVLTFVVKYVSVILQGGNLFRVYLAISSWLISSLMVPDLISRGTRELV